MASDEADRISPHGPPATSVAFLLAQLGAHATGMFAERIGEIGLTPPQAGVLRIIAGEAGLSQQAVARRLGLLPSRLVGFVDELEERGYVERVRNKDDRRNYALHLTENGREQFASLGELAKQHEDAVCAELAPADRTELVRLLKTLADAHDLTAGVHPGYRHLGAGR